VSVRNPSGGAEGGRLAWELKLAGCKRLAEIGEELPAEDLREGFDGEEEALPRRGPPLAVAGECAAGDEAVEVDMVEELLVPGVQDGREADLGGQAVLGVRGELVQGLGGPMEQDVVDRLLVGECQRVEGVREREDGVEVLDGQKLALACLQPPGLREGLALRAVAIAAGVVGRALEPAGIAPLDVPAEAGRATDLDGVHHREVRGRQGVVAAVRFAVQAEDVGDLPARPLGAGWHVGTGGGHGSRLFHGLKVAGLEKVQRTRRGIQLLAGDLDVADGRANRIVAHEQLDRADVDARLQQVGGEAMAQRVNAALLVDSRSFLGLAVDGAYSRPVRETGWSDLAPGKSQSAGR